MKSIAIGGTVAAAGCTAFVGDDNSSGDSSSDAPSTDGPEGVTASFFRALDANEFDTARGLVHDDTPDEEAQLLLASDQEYLDRLSGLEFSIESTETVEKTEDEAVVEIELTETRDGQSQPVTARFELRKQEGEWILWDNTETNR